MRNRKKKNGKSRLTNLSSLIISPETVESGTIGTLYPTDRPMRLEIGCGKGDFITGISEKEPDFNYIAVERIPDVALIALEKYAGKKGLGKLGEHGEWICPDGTALKGEEWDVPCEMRGNVRFFIGAAESFLPYAPSSSFDSVYANFSDPWPKKGYVGRRLSNPGYLKEYKRILGPGGRLNLKTDNDGLFDYSIESLEAEGWKIIFLTRDLHSAETPEEIRAANVVTEYESRFIEQGIKIKALIAEP